MVALVLLAKLLTAVTTAVGAVDDYLECRINVARACLSSAVAFITCLQREPATTASMVLATRLRAARSQCRTEAARSQCRTEAPHVVSAVASCRNHASLLHPQATNALGGAISWRTGFARAHTTVILLSTFKSATRTAALVGTLQLVHTRS